MLRNSGLTQRYKIISTLRSRFSGQLYKVESTQRNSTSLMLVLSLPIAGLSDRQRKQLDEVEKLFQTHDQALSLEAISLESNQLIVVQPWYEFSTLDQGAQLSIEEGRQLLLQSLEFVLVARSCDINPGGLQPDSLSWDGKKLTVLPLGAIVAQIQSPNTSDLAQLASSVIWSMTHLSVEPGRAGQFWQAQIQLEDPDLRQVLESLLSEQVTDPQVAITQLQPKPSIAPNVIPESQVTSKSLRKDETELKPGAIASTQQSKVYASELVSAELVTQTSQPSRTDNGPLIAGVLGGCLGIACLIGLPLTIALLSNRNPSEADPEVAKQEQLERELQETRRALEEERARSASRPPTPSPPPTSSNPPSSSSSRPESVNSSIEWQPSCGSQRGSGTTWWPVKAEVSSLKVMKEVYCGDAYIRGSNVQIASFTDQSEAQAFASLITSETGYRVFVGAPIYRD